MDAAGFALDPDGISVLDKGQRSVNGLASGFENVVTADLILSMRKLPKAEAKLVLVAPPSDALTIAVDDLLRTGARPTPTHVYLGVVRDFLRRGWDVSGLNISGIGPIVARRGYEVDRASCRLVRRSEPSYR